MDVAILRAGSVAAASGDSSASFYDVEGFFEEFAFTLRNELDYTIEGDNAERLRGIHRDDGLFIPTIYWDYSTTRVLVMDEVRGPDFADAAPAEPPMIVVASPRFARVYWRVSSRSSRRDSRVGSQGMPPFAPPKGRPASAVFHVMIRASAVTSLAFTPG